MGARHRDCRGLLFVQHLLGSCLLLGGFGRGLESLPVDRVHHENVRKANYDSCDRVNQGSRKYVEHLVVPSVKEIKGARKDIRQYHNAHHELQATFLSLQCLRELVATVDQAEQIPKLQK